MADLTSQISLLYRQSIDALVSFGPESLLWLTVLLSATIICMTVWALKERKYIAALSHDMREQEQQQQRELVDLQHSFQLSEHDYESRLVNMSEQLGVARRRADSIGDQLQAAQAAYYSAINERDVAIEKCAQIPVLTEHSDILDRQLDRYRTEAGLAQTEVAALGVQLKEEQKAAADKLKVLDDAKERLGHEFETLANRIFEAKTEKMESRHKQALESTLTPLRDQLSGFKKKVEDVYEKETRERMSLLHEVSALKNLNQKMSSDAVNLTRALKGDNKYQGNWGELILERVLENSGLSKGREYETQLSMNDEDGKRRVPDVIVHLPDNRDLVIDAKASLVDYERFCSAEDEQEKQAALQAHISSVRRHIKDLSIKAYQELDAVQTLDFVFIFIPIESAFLLAFENDNAMFQEAYDRNIVVVSPTTLLATLRTVQNIWRYERQNKNAEIIAKQAGGLHDQFVRVLESLGEMGRQIEKTQSSYDTMMSRFTTGKGNLLNRVKGLENLGAKTRKQMPAEMDSLLQDNNGLDPSTADQVENTPRPNNAERSAKTTKKLQAKNKKIIETEI